MSYSVYIGDRHVSHRSIGVEEVARIMRKAINESLPLREPTFLILVSLGSGEKHGYAILKDVQELSHGRIRLSTGTLYGALGRLLDQGLIERVPSEDAGGGRPRKAYVLTRRGHHVLEMEMTRMQGLVAAARLRLAEEDA